MNVYTRKHFAFLRKKSLSQIYDIEVFQITKPLMKKNEAGFLP